MKTTKTKIEINSCKIYEGKLKNTGHKHSSRHKVLSKRYWFQLTVEVLIQVLDLDDYCSLKTKNDKKNSQKQVPMIIPQFKLKCVNVYMSKKSEASFMYLSVSSMKAEWLEFSNVTHLTFWILSKNGCTTKSWEISLRPLVINVGTRTRCKRSIIDQFCRTLERKEKVCKYQK